VRSVLRGSPSNRNAWTAFSASQDSQFGSSMDAGGCRKRAGSQARRARDSILRNSLAAASHFCKSLIILFYLFVTNDNHHLSRIILAKSLIPWISLKGSPLLYIEQRWQRAQGAYRPNTRKAWALDGVHRVLYLLE